MGHSPASHLTTAEFWDRYWHGIELPKRVDLDFSFDRCVAQRLLEMLGGVSGDLLEVGCAPGRWMEFLSRNLGLVPSGIEYSPAGIAVTRRNLELLGVIFRDLWAADFLSLPPRPRFDVVLSLGFIEHFQDAHHVVDLHLRWLKSDGTLVLGVPNFRGIYRPIQKLLDPAVLAEHNLGTMSPGFFQEVAARHRLRIKYLDYLGSFEPSLPMFPTRTGNPRFSERVVGTGLSLARWLRKARGWDLVNSRLFSSYILAVFERRSTP